MQRIESPHNERLKKVVQLFSSRGRKKQDRFVVVGWREVRRCLESPIQVESVFVHESESVWLGDELKERRLLPGAQQFEVESAAFEKLQYGDRDNRVVAVAKRPDTSLDRFAIKDTPFYLIVEAIEKPGNLGAVFRSCDGAGVDGIIVASPLTDVFHPNSIRASMGTVFSMPFAIANSGVVREWLRKNDFLVFATCPNAKRDYFETDFTSRTAVVLGNEASGLSRDWANAQVEQLKLPMLGIADSLNVSVTASVIVYENLRQRSPSKTSTKR